MILPAMRGESAKTTRRVGDVGKGGNGVAGGGGPGWIRGMKHGLAMGLIGMLLAAVSVRAEEAFSKIIRPEDFAAAAFAPPASLGRASSHRRRYFD